MDVVSIERSELMEVRTVSSRVVQFVEERSSVLCFR